jgi:aspartyl-tRNA(Asn)/glutamyl-tRNA(Gln) amidotransferase subunit B
MLGPVKATLHAQQLEIEDFALRPDQLAGIIQMVDEGKISHTMATQQLFPALLKHADKTATELAQELNLVQERNEDALLLLIEEVLAAMPQKVQEYKKGKKGLIGLFVGEVMKKSKGKADPKLLNQLVTDCLSK